MTEPPYICEECREISIRLRLAGDNHSGVRADLVDDDDTVIERGAVLAVLRARDLDVGAHRVLRLHPGPKIAPARARLVHVADDRDQPPARHQTVERRQDVLRPVHGVALALHATRGGRERRVHHDHRRTDIVRQDVVDHFRVLGRDRSARQDAAQHLRATGRELVEHDVGAGQPAEHGEAADAGRGLEVGLARADVGDPVGHEGQRGRRAELLKLVLLGGALRGRRQ
jgi:hypothetical protein